MTHITVNRPFHDSSGVLHHIELYVTDLKISTEFWDWLLLELGYMRYRQWEQGVSWKRRDTGIVLLQADPDFLSAPGDRRHIGLNHIAFHARSRRQVDDLTRELHRRGVSMLYAEDHPGDGGPTPYAIYFEDPDRIMLEVIAPD